VLAEKLGSNVVTHPFVRFLGVRFSTVEYFLFGTCASSGAVKEM
jgi:hypothetical protein